MAVIIGIVIMIKKTPKRGPGVANLEKILRKDKENKTDLDHHHHYQQLVQHTPTFFLQKSIPQISTIIIL